MIAARVEEAPDRAHDRAALAEDLAHVGVHHQVDVALAVADLDVLQAVPLLGQRARRFGQHDRLVGQDRQLAGACEHRAADRAHEVAALGLLPQLVGRVADLVLLYIDLDLARAVQDLHERRLAEPAVCDDAARDRELVVREQRRWRALVRLFTLVLGRLDRRRDAGKPGYHLGRRMRRYEVVGIRIRAQGADLSDLFLSFGNELLFVCHRLSTGHQHA